MRGLAALFVMFFHLRYSFGAVEPINYKLFEVAFLTKAYLWVDFFFILSGFILTYRYHFEFEYTFKFFKRFIFHRWLRIYPLHFVTLMAFLAMSIFMFGLVEIRAFKLSILTNLLLIQSWGYYLGKTWNYPSWSLSEEWGAYLLFVFLMSLVIKVRHSKIAQFMIIFGSFVSLLLFNYFVHPADLDMTEDFGIVRCLLEFTVGMGLFHFRDLTKAEMKGSDCDILAWISSFAILLVMQMQLADINVILLFIFLIFFLSLANGSLARLLNHRVLHFLGKISFSIYVWHAFFGKLFENSYHSLGEPKMSLIAGGLSYLLLCILIVGFSVISYEVFEKRFYMRFKAGMVQKKQLLKT